MSLSELVVPVLLCFTACYALGKRVDVYTALTRGAEEGLKYWCISSPRSSRC